MRLVLRLSKVLALGVALVPPAAPAVAASQSATGSFVEGPVENEQFVGDVAALRSMRDHDLVSVEHASTTG